MGGVMMYTVLRICGFREPQDNRNPARREPSLDSIGHGLFASISKGRRSDADSTNMPRPEPRGRYTCTRDDLRL